MKTMSLLLVSLVLSAVSHAYDKNHIAQHLRKSLNLDTRTEITVSSSATPSNFGSLKVVPVTINGGPYQVFLSQDEKQYIWGYAVDLTVDPDEMRARSLNLNNVRSKGAASAPITIVEFTDMQCPYCKNVHEILKKELHTAYSPNDVRLVFKHYPLSNHAWAESAAIATECAGDLKPEAFWKMADSIFSNSVNISTGNIKGKVVEFAKSAGLDEAKFAQCYDSGKHLAKVQYDRREGTMAGVNSTPTLFINGRMLRGIRSFEDVKVVVEEKRKEAAKKK